MVFNVRGNGGGNSEWGEEIVSAFWGDVWAKRAEALTGGNVVDWRASALNLATLRDEKKQIEAAGLDTGYTHRAIDAITTAIQDGNPLARVVEPSEAVSQTPPPNPVTRRVYFLTDGSCGSARLDFADLMHRLPGVVQVGQPTGADTVYMDIARKELPSGLASLGWGMQVYRDRTRGNNVWYDPKIRWTGGPMNDDAAVVRWIKSLH